MFGKLFRGIGLLAKSTVMAAVPALATVVEPSMLVNLVGGAVLKHVVPSDKVNKFIPYFSMAGSIGYELVTRAADQGIEAAVASGVTRAALAWAAHRSIKEPLRASVKNPALAAKVGPGMDFSV